MTQSNLSAHRWSSVDLDTSAANRVREYLLRYTVQHAHSRSPFYRKRIGRLAGTIETLADLAKLPLLEKSDLTEHLDDLRTFQRYPDYLMYTSGTTGAPLEVPVYREETEACEKFLIAGWQEKSDGNIPLTGMVIRVGHGTHILTGSVPSIPIHINYGLDQFLKMMRSEHWVGGHYQRIEILDANVLSIRQITKELIYQGIDPRSLEVDTIVLAGWYLPSWERRFLAETWGSLILQKYGVTEVHGDARLCLDCDYYHFDFTVIPEVLDPDSRQPIEEGVGLMALTGLYPFNQAIPKIRYVVGDLVELAETECRSREKGVRFLSRAGDAVRLSSAPAGPWSLFSSDVAEALAPLPDVARKEKTGFYKFRMCPQATGALIEVELVYPPQLYPSRVEEIRTHILRSLPDRAVVHGEPTITFQPPGEISRITKL